ncbi:histidine kinase [Sphaerotilus mobilis]|uniref:Two-component system sensor histidine kinase UhpB n=1 Tax=Sphaerotilus mobilis TaxID=47994 RepID=A0A4V2EW27_9BURK|nr:histidine kinase [Sphaerotilus mobilis]RZS54530.1 two-component system sensor histidine kinase UhpB [Sphaerotilus mobilis]
MSWSPPFDLPRLVMRRAFATGLAGLLLAAALGLMRVNQNIAEEVDAAMSLASVMARLGALDQVDDRSALASVRETLAQEGLRHLTLHIVDSHGRVILRPLPPPPDPGPLGWLYELHRQTLSAPDGRRATWAVRRPDGGRWVVSLAASHESERIEALNDLAGALALLLACFGALLLAMAWNVRRAFAPLTALLAAIGRLEHQDDTGVRQLPRMPIRELESIATALRALVQALDAAESERRVLSQQVLTLQEDERHHLARELHDEFGQRLTALRLDAAWLGRRLADQPELHGVVTGMAERCAEVQRDIRDLLVRLRPLGPVDDGDDDESSLLPLARLVQLLDSLVAGWQASARGDGEGEGAAAQDSAAPTRWRLTLTQIGHPAMLGALALPLDPAVAASTRIPRDLALAVYRISQEALTNAARHAGAREVELSLTLGLVSQPPTLEWSVQDDGIGLPDAALARQRGNGLGGMQERVWALGGTWTVGPAHAADGSAGSTRPGLRLSARLTWKPTP